LSSCSKANYSNQAKSHLNHALYHSVSSFSLLNPSAQRSCESSSLSHHEP
jgi:hypothetical protein